MTKTQEDFFIKIFTSHFIARVRKGCSRFACERELETEHNWNMLTPKLTAISVVSFSFPRAAQPEAQRPLCWVMAFFTASYQHLLRTSTHQGPKAPLAWWGFPYLISSITPSDLQLNWPELQLARQTQLSYIIVRRPLDLWNRMFNRHQAEITVLQFRGHSLPVRQSMRVSWFFLACPILLANFRPCDFFS